jgi:prepilin-type N-terminal cleavage/methylation domain-containing protein
MYRKQKGFTLVEIILVTVIIAILAGTVISVINIPRIQARSRDSRRVGDIKRMQTALELHFADNRSYPDFSTSWVEVNTAGFSTAMASYISDTPQDPRNGESSGVSCFGSGNYGYWYRTTAGGATYVLGTIVEMAETAEDDMCSSVPNCANAAYACPTATATRCYCVQNPM